MSELTEIGAPLAGPRLRKDRPTRRGTGHHRVRRNGFPNGLVWSFLAMAALATRTTGRHYGETLPRVPASALAARRLVCNTLTSWGVGELAEQAAVIVSELVANTVQHARRESIRVTVEHTAPGTVRIATADFSRRLPVPRLPGEDDEGGRGLALVEAMAQRWGVEERRWGKIVWAEVTR